MGKGEGQILHPLPPAQGGSIGHQGEVYMIIRAMLNAPWMTLEHDMLILARS